MANTYWLSTNANRKDWDRPDALSSPTLNITKVSGLIAGVINAVGVALLALVKKLAGIPDPVAIAVFSVVAISILAFALIASMDILARAKVSAAFASANPARGLWVRVREKGDDPWLVVGVRSGVDGAGLKYVVTRNEDRDEVAPDLIETWPVR